MLVTARLSFVRCPRWRQPDGDDKKAAVHACRAEDERRTIRRTEQLYYLFLSIKECVKKTRAEDLSSSPKLVWRQRQKSRYVVFAVFLAFSFFSGVKPLWFSPRSELDREDKAGQNFVLSGIPYPHFKTLAAIVSYLLFNTLSSSLLSRRNTETMKQVKHRICRNVSFHGWTGWIGLY